MIHDPRSHRFARLLCTSISAATVLSTSPSCAVQRDPDELAEDDATDSDEATAARRRVDDPSAAGLGLAVDLQDPLPPLPDPSLFGVDPDPAHWDLPHVSMLVPAREASAIDPEIVELEVELVMRPSDRPDRYVEATLDVTARDADGNVRAWADLDSDRDDHEGTASRALVLAMLADLGAQAEQCDALTTEAEATDASPTLTDAADPQAGGGLPGAAAWWGRVLCGPSRQAHLLQYFVARATLLIQSEEFIVAMAACTVAACEDAATDAEFIIEMQARPSLDASLQYATLGYVVADGLRNVAAGLGLGGVVGPNAWPVAVVGNGLVQMSIGRAAVSMAQRTVAQLAAALVRIEQYPQLAPAWQFGAQFTAPATLLHRDAVVTLVRCYDRVARWVAAAGLVGFVALVALNAADEGGDVEALTWQGLSRGPLGRDLTAAPDVQADGPVDLSGFSVVSGPWLPRANQQAALAPLVHDIAALPEHQRAATLQQNQGRMHRTLRFGYAEPHATIAQDAWGLDELTGFPVLLAAAGSPVVLTQHLDEYDAPKLEGQGNRAVVRAVLFDLIGQEIDGDGNPIGEPFACVGLDNTCPLGVETTGSPEQIEAGDVVARHWRIIATSSIVDVVTGLPIELPAGHEVTIVAPVERPEDPCWDTFDYDAWTWLRNPSAECGGDVAVPPGGPGGGGGGGGGGPFG